MEAYKVNQAFTVNEDDGSKLTYAQIAQGKWFILDGGHWHGCMNPFEWFARQGNVNTLVESGFHVFEFDELDAVCVAFNVYFGLVVEKKPETMEEVLSELDATFGKFEPQREDVEAFYFLRHEENGSYEVKVWKRSLNVYGRKLGSNDEFVCWC